MRLVREGDGVVVVEPLELADTFGARLRGLMGRASLPARGGLWLEPCSSIHMLLMRFAIDVVFLRRAPGPLGPGARGEVLKVCPDVTPWLGMAWCPGASSALELPAGRAGSLGLQAGDMLALEAA